MKVLCLLYYKVVINGESRHYSNEGGGGHNLNVSDTKFSRIQQE